VTSAAAQIKLEIQICGVRDFMSDSLFVSRFGKMVVPHAAAVRNDLLHQLDCPHVVLPVTTMGIRGADVYNSISRTIRTGIENLRLSWLSPTPHPRGSCIVICMWLRLS
jgi:hypothetical protein